MNGPSPHFAWAEFASHDGTPYPAKWRRTRGARLAAVLEGFREHLGGMPLELGSVYRTPRWNRANGGAARSQHPQGRAADPHPPWLDERRMGRAQFHAAARAYAALDRRVGGLGLYTWGVHLDTRPRTGGRLVIWNQVAAKTRIHDQPAKA